MVSKALESKKKRDRDEEENVKKNKKFSILVEKNQLLSRKIESLEVAQEGVRIGYGQKLVEK